MNDLAELSPPTVLAELILATKELGFELASEPLTGSLLRTLAASKPSAKFLEIGTGTGIGTAWLLAGMDPRSSLITVESEQRLIEVAGRFLGTDPRVTFRNEDAATFLESLPAMSFDFIFADTWAGKYTHLDAALELLNLGGLYVIDDMLPQSTWSADHLAQSIRLIAELSGRSDLILTRLDWGSGIIIAARIGNAR